MDELGKRATTSGTVYLTGGSTALLLGLREQTVDVDVKLDPEPGGAFEAIADLKRSLGINVELAAPDQFIPELPGWRERSPLIKTAGQVQFRHYDFYSQALAKIERGHATDVSDARSLVSLRLIALQELQSLFEAIVPLLDRYPAIDPSAFANQVGSFVRSCIGE